MAQPLEAPRERALELLPTGGRDPIPGDQDAAAEGTETHQRRGAAVTLANQLAEAASDGVGRACVANVTAVLPDHRPGRPTHLSETHHERVDGIGQLLLASVP